MESRQSVDVPPNTGQLYAVTNAVGMSPNILKVDLLAAARRTVEGDAVDGKEYIYVLSQWSLSTLKAEELPTDVKMCLNEVFVKGTGPNTEFAESAISDSKDRSETSGLGQLEANLSSARAMEFETLLLKYTRRQNH